MQKSIQEIIGQSLSIIRGDLPTFKSEQEAAQYINHCAGELRAEVITLDLSRIPAEEQAIKAAKDNDNIIIIDTQNK